MQKRSSKPRDLNKMAAAIVADAIDGRTDDEKAVDEGKNPAAVALGRLGGKKGGKARAEKLSSKKRREIASRAAKARWAAQKRD